MDISAIQLALPEVISHGLPTIKEGLQSAVGNLLSDPWTYVNVASGIAGVAEGVWECRKYMTRVAGYGAGKRIYKPTDSEPLKVVKLISTGAALYAEAAKNLSHVPDTLLSHGVISLGIATTASYLTKAVGDFIFRDEIVGR